MNVKVEIPLDITEVVTFIGFMRRRRAVADLGRGLRIRAAVGTDTSEYRTAHRAADTACDRTEHRFDISRDITADASEYIADRADDIAADRTKHVAADISIDIPADVSEQIVTDIAVDIAVNCAEHRASDVAVDVSRDMGENAAGNISAYRAVHIKVEITCNVFGEVTLMRGFAVCTDMDAVGGFYCILHRA